MEIEQQKELIKSIAQWIRLASEKVASITIELTDGTLTTFQITKENKNGDE